MTTTEIRDHRSDEHQELRGRTVDRFCTEESSWSVVLETTGWRRSDQSENNGDAMWTRRTPTGHATAYTYADHGQQWVKFDGNPPRPLEIDTPYSPLEALAAMAYKSDQEAALDYLIDNALVSPDAARGNISGPRIIAATDDGVALLLARDYSDKVMNVTGVGWHAFVGGRWIRDDNKAKNFVRHLIRGLDSDPKWSQWVKRSGLRAATIDSALRLAQTDERLQVDPDSLDASATIVNTPTGAIDCRTGELLGSNPALRLTKCTPVPVALEETAPRFESFLWQTFGGDAELIRYVQLLLGLSALGLASERLFLIAHGETATGKSTLTNLAKRVLGESPSGYAVRAPLSLFTSSKFEKHSSDTFALDGARMVIASEAGKHAAFDEAALKALTGNDSISTRALYQERRETQPTFTIWLTTNHIPSIDPDDGAAWARIRVIPFKHGVQKDEVNSSLGEQLYEEEGPQILGWMVDGARAYLRDGLGSTPAAVRDATSRYRSIQDPLRQFIAATCEFGDGYFLENRDRNEAYRLFRADSGDEVDEMELPSTRQLLPKFGDRVQIGKNKSGVRGLRGVRLNDEWDGRLGESADAG